jgi:hypothetical protein
MNTESFTLDWKTNSITVTFENGTSKEYLDADSYIADFPERVADAVAMGWVGGSDNSGWADSQ